MGKLLAADDLTAYNELFDRYIPVLYKQANRYIRNAHNAEEIIMDLMFNIWEKRFGLGNFLPLANTQKGDARSFFIILEASQLQLVRLFKRPE